MGAARELSLVLAGGMLCVTGCGMPAQVDQASGETGANAAAGQCERFTATALGVDAAVDRGPSDARDRAVRRFGAAALRTQLAGDEQQAMWPLLVAHHAHVVVGTGPSGAPSLVGHQLGITVAATRRALGADGWDQVLPPARVHCSLLAGDQGWRVVAATFSYSADASADRHG